MSYSLSKSFLPSSFATLSCESSTLGPSALKLRSTCSSLLVRCSTFSSSISSLLSTNSESWFKTSWSVDTSSWSGLSSFCSSLGPRFTEPSS
ncbi:hypothetical protein GDO78_018285 [Eleutherodactylus coqui]|uniref:Uncharacterized protein n=1 Tax=Eleutherodactylus coqui TaxID=57060 RepID=A0A8J6EN95_ELECQ|nr:hypothetical protein GDO78_018285 [Eleutherodactylus coqui]